MARLAGAKRNASARRMLQVAAAVACTAAPGFAQTAPAPRPDSTGTVVGIVVMKDGGLPLSYSIVSALALGRDRFSNDQGVFALTELPAGPLTLRVRHLGYAPANLSVVVRPGEADTVRVALTHIAVRLSVVQVHAFPECKNPGAPAASADSAFATVFDQLHQNADQYRLLTRTYPFVFAVERTMSRGLVNGEMRVDGVDTATIAGESPWEYQPGTVVARSGRTRLFGTTFTMNIPTLVQFADRAFIENHCFYNGGVESIDGIDLLRVDFVAASRISAPDVNGSMYLDPVTFRIRRSVLRLTRIPKELAGLTETEAVTAFGEILSSIPVIAGVSAVSHYAADSGRPQSEASAYEEQRTIRVQFLKGMPGEDPKRPY